MLRPRSFWAVLAFFTVFPAVTSAQTNPTPKEAQPAKDLYGDPLPERAIARCGTVRFRHEGNVLCVALSPDSKHLASADDAGFISLWDVNTGKILRQLRLFQGDVVPGPCALDFSSDGKILAAMNLDASLLLWDLTTGHQLHKFMGDFAPDLTNAVRFSADGRTLAAAVGHCVTLLKADTGKEIRNLKCPANVQALTFSPDGRTLAVGMQPRAAQVWDVVTGKLRHGIEGDVGFGYAVAFSPDGKLLASGGYNRIILSEAATGKEIGQLYTLMEWIQFLAFLPDGKTAVSYSTDGVIRFWDVATRKVRLQLESKKGPLQAAALSRNGKTLAASSGVRIRLWDTASGRELFTNLPGHDASVESIAFAPDGRTLASAGQNEPIRLWETATGKQQRQLKGDSAHLVLFSPDGKRLASLWQANKTIQIWNSATGEPLVKMADEQGEGFLPGMAFCNQGKALVSIDSRESQEASDRQACHFLVWDVATGRLLREFSSPLMSGSRWPVAFAADGTAAALQSSAPRSIQVWNLERTEQFVELSGDSASVLCLALSANSQLLASEAASGAVRLWEVASGQEILDLRGHERPVTALAFSPNGRFLASGDGSMGPEPKGVGPHRIYLWDLATGKQILQFQGHGSGVTSLVFPPGGTRLASGFRNGTILVWDVSAIYQTAPRQGKELAPEALEKLWAELAGQDAYKAHRAIWTLSATKEQAVRLLKSRLKPAEATDPKRIRQLIAELDHSKFAVRKTATRELEALADEAESVLRQALKENPSLEVRRRVETILTARHTVRSAEALRRIRAIQVLEHIGSRDAQGILHTLAKGRSGAHETLDAQAALQRLTERR